MQMTGTVPSTGDTPSVNGSVAAHDLRKDEGYGIMANWSSNTSRFRRVRLFCDERRARPNMVLHSAKRVRTKPMTCYTTGRRVGGFLPPGAFKTRRDIYISGAVYPAHARPSR